MHAHTRRVPGQVAGRGSQGLAHGPLTRTVSLGVNLKARSGRWTLARARRSSRSISPEPPAKQQQQPAAEGPAPRQDAATAAERAAQADTAALMASAMGAHVLRFKVPHYATSLGNALAIVGSAEEIGSWQPTRGVRMTWSPGHSWTCDVFLPETFKGTVEYKIVLLSEKGNVTWEGGPNRVLDVPPLVPQGDNPNVQSIELYWGVREPTLSLDSEEPDMRGSVEEVVKLKAEQAAEDALKLPGNNAAMVLLQAHQKLATAKAKHRKQLTELREELVSLQESSKREVARMEGRMRQLEGLLEEMQARNVKESAAAEAQIHAVEARIKANAIVEAKAKAAAEAAAAAAAAEAAAAAKAAPAAKRGRRKSPSSGLEDAGLAAFEAPVLSMLSHYSGLALDRLHNMLRSPNASPSFDRSAEELATLMSHLVEQGKVTLDGGLYRYKSSGRAGSRVRTPSAARGPSPASASAATPSSAATADAPSPAAASPSGLSSDVMAVEYTVLSVLSNYSGVTLTRLHKMLQSVVPGGFGATQGQLASLMEHLVAEGKVVQEGEVFKYRALRAPTPRSRSASPPPVPSTSASSTATTTVRRRSPGSTSSSPAVAAPPPAPRAGTPRAPRGSAAPPPVPTSSYASASSMSYEDDGPVTSAPPGSVAGGPPGSVAGGPPPGWNAGSSSNKGSIMPSFDSTGAHPVLAEVSKWESQVLRCLSRLGTMHVSALHHDLRKSSEGFAKSEVELHAILKQLKENHKVEDLGSGLFKFLRF